MLFDIYALNSNSVEAAHIVLKAVRIPNTMFKGGEGPTLVKVCYTDTYGTGLKLCHGVTNLDNDKWKAYLKLTNQQYECMRSPIYILSHDDKRPDNIRLR